MSSINTIGGGRLVLSNGSPVVLVYSFERQNTGMFIIYNTYSEPPDFEPPPRDPIFSIPRYNWKRGRSYVQQNGIEGYCVFVGRNAMPDFDAEPAGFSATFPASLSIEIPTEPMDLYVVVRKRNSYGIYSQNQHATILRVDATGNLMYSDITLPVNLVILPSPNEYFKILAMYEGFDFDFDLADEWRVYFSEGSPPDPSVDAPVFSGTISSQYLNAKVGPYPTGNTTYHAAVTLYRTVDGFETAAVTASLTVDDPPTPQPLHGAFLIK